MTLALPEPDVQQRVTDEETGQRFYLVDDETFWSVTTATSVIGKDQLTFWAAGMAAAWAFDEMPTILNASLIKPCGRTYYKCKHEFGLPHIADECACRVCETCLVKRMAGLHDVHKKRRADEGRRTHNVIEWWSLNAGEWIDFDDDIALYVASFRAFVEQYGITPDDFLMTEAIVIHRGHRFAGTTDGILQIHADRTRAAAELVARVLSRATGEQITADEATAQHLTVALIVDWKTQDKDAEHEKFYGDQALQLAGYRHAETVRIGGIGVEERMPHTDGAMLVHLRPDGATARLTVADETTFGAFLHALELFRWLNEYGTAAVSVRSFPLPKPKPVKALKAAPKRTLATATAETPKEPVRRAPAKKAAPRQDLLNMFATPLTHVSARPGNELRDSDIPF